MKEGRTEGSKRASKQARKEGSKETCNSDKISPGNLSKYWKHGQSARRSAVLFAIFKTLLFTSFPQNCTKRIFLDNYHQQFLTCHVQKRGTARSKWELSSEFILFSNVFADPAGNRLNLKTVFLLSMPSVFAGHTQALENVALTEATPLSTP